jgi:hypothetical protein
MMAILPTNPKSAPTRQAVQDERAYIMKSSGERVELEHLPGRLLLALDKWLADLVDDVNGGYGEIWIEVVGGEIKRVKPTESWMASLL